jgi:ribosomal protein L7/L12
MPRVHAGHQRLIEEGEPICTSESVVRRAVARNSLHPKKQTNPKDASDPARRLVRIRAMAVEGKSARPHPSTRKEAKMDYLNMTPRELALTLMYAAEVGHVDPDLAREAATRIHPDIYKESAKAQAARYREMLGERSKIVAIKKYREETGCALKDAKDYIDRIEEDLARAKAGTDANTPRLNSGPMPRFVRCDKCNAEIEYLPEDVEERHGTDYSGGPDGYKRVKCPRPGCDKGYGYVERW